VHESEGEKLHQGVASKKSALHQGIDASNSTIVLGLQSTAALNRIRSRCTGKERDSESNLDNFGARYYASTTGRFMSPDWALKPISVPYANFGDPQSLNLYSYVNNNPTTTRDPDGHCLEDACVVEGTVAGVILLSSYLASPPGQQMLHNAASGIVSLGSSISSFFHPDNSGQNAAPPPSTPTNVSQGTPGTTATNVATGTPASVSQQGAVDNSPMESRSFSPGVKAGADANAGGKCEYCGAQTVPSQQSQAGVTTPSNARQTDHYIPSSQGGSNTADNAVNSCVSCNNAKSNTQPQGTQYQLPRMQKPPDQQ
jgi:RHS repeat-associated protein